MQGMSDGSRERSPATVGEQDERAGLRALPSVERLLQTEPLRSAAAAGGSRTLALGVVQAAAGPLPGGDPRRQRRRAGTRRARRASGRGAEGARSPASRAGDQRDRRRDPHQPRPRPAAARRIGRARGDRQRLLEPGVRRRGRARGAAVRRMSRTCSGSSPVRRRRWRSTTTQPRCCWPWPRSPAGARWWSRAGSWSRSAGRSGSRRSWRPRVRAWSRPAPRTGPGSGTTSARSVPTPRL